MGKSNRNLTAEEKTAARQQLSNEKTAAAKKEKQKKAITIACVALCALLVLSLTVFSILTENGVFMRNTVVLATENCEVDQAMLSYFTYLTYQNFASTYGDYLSMFGLNSALPLKSQEAGENYSWFQYFEDSAVESLENILVYAEAAKAAGKTLDADDLTAIDETIEEMKHTAKDHGMSLNTFLATNFGAGVKEQDVRRAMELTTLATNYENELLESFDFDDDALLEYFNEHKKEYQYVDYLKYTIVSDLTTLDQTSETYEEDMEALFEANGKLAEELAAITDEDAFKDWIKNHLEDVVYDIDSETDEEAIEKLKEEIEKDLEELLQEKVKYTDNDVMDWIHDEARNDVTFVEDDDDGTYVIYLLLEEPYAEEFPSSEELYILSFDKKGHDDPAAAAADALDKFEASEKTAEDFEKLAEELKITDYKFNDVTSTKTSVPSVVLDWAFTPDRAAGEYTILEDTGKDDDEDDSVYYIVFVEEVSEDTAWEASVRNTLETEELQKVFDEFTAKYPVTKNQKAIDRLAR